MHYQSSKTPLVTVIMPVYNGEKYIKDGIKAVQQQSLLDIELIIVDDGSTDKTAWILDEEAKKDPRIRVFHEKHYGVAHARQIGIDNVKGEYTIHFDSDDWYDPSMLERLFLFAEEEQADMVICDWVIREVHETIHQSQKPTELTCEAVANDIVSGKLHGSLCNKLIRTSCFKDNKVVFRQELTLREDLFFILDSLFYIKKIVYLPESLYTYIRISNLNSITQTYFDDAQKYYVQEFLFYTWILQYPLIYEERLLKIRSYLLNIAYRSMLKGILDKKKWCNMLKPYREELSKAMSSKYDKFLVLAALNYSYPIAKMAGKTLEWARRKKIKMF